MIIDISQELLNSNIYAGDEKPKSRRVKSMDNGEKYNLTNISCCVHNGTHVDAPFHFINDGKTISDISLEAFVGDCYVATYDGILDANAVHNIMAKALSLNSSKRILVRGKAIISLEAAKAFNEYGVILIGNESQTIGPENAPMGVHQELLGKGVVLLEGIVLTQVEDGKYFLSCAPINIKGADGSMCRAYLIRCE